MDEGAAIVRQLQLVVFADLMLDGETPSLGVRILDIGVHIFDVAIAKKVAGPGRGAIGARRRERPSGGTVVDIEQVVPVGGAGRYGIAERLVHFVPVGGYLVEVIILGVERKAAAEDIFLQRMP